MKEKTTGHLACFIAYAIFGINIIVCKDLTSSRLISPIALFCLRSLGAGSLFWLISCFLPKEKVEKKDYGKTLNLPQTDFPMRANLPENEPKIQADVFENDLYEKMLHQQT